MSGTVSSHGVSLKLREVCGELVVFGGKRDWVQLAQFRQRTLNKRHLAKLMPDVRQPIGNQ
jgi:hypothetical protein